MDEILEKMDAQERDIRQALVFFQTGFQKGGLTLAEVYAAMNEFEPVLRQLIKPHTGEFQLPERLGLSAYQVAAIRKAHAEYLQGVVLHYRRNIWHALKIIAKLLGRHNYNS